MKRNDTTEGTRLSFPRRCWELHFREKWKYQEIAEHFNVELGLVKRLTLKCDGWIKERTLALGRGKPLRDFIRVGHPDPRQLSGCEDLRNVGHIIDVAWSDERFKVLRKRAGVVIHILRWATPCVGGARNRFHHSLEIVGGLESFRTPPFREFILRCWRCSCCWKVDDVVPNIIIEGSP